jgi:hypothetical protein
MYKMAGFSLPVYGTSWSKDLDRKMMEAEKARKAKHDTFNPGDFKKWVENWNQRQRDEKLRAAVDGTEGYMMTQGTIKKMTERFDLFYINADDLLMLMSHQVDVKINDVEPDSFSWRGMKLEGCEKWRLSRAARTNLKTARRQGYKVGPRWIDGDWLMIVKDAEGIDAPWPLGANKINWVLLPDVSEEKEEKD